MLLLGRTGEDETWVADIFDDEVPGTSQRFLEYFPRTIQACNAPVRSRTLIAGSSGSERPFENAMPSVYSRQ